MDWNNVIERNIEALQRILATLFAMAGFTADHDSRSIPKATLPRHLRSSLLHLLRPAESAVRRLIIVAARGMTVTLAPMRPRKAEAVPIDPALRRLGIAVNLTTNQIAALAARKRKAKARTARLLSSPPRLTLALTDPRFRLGFRRRYVSGDSLPRIGWADTLDYRPPRSSNDPVDASHLCMRLQAVRDALNDIPAQAKRFARWRARRNRALQAGHLYRQTPLRPGPGYGLRSPNARRPKHEVDEVLRDLHYFAYDAWKLDTS